MTSRLLRNLAGLALLSLLLAVGQTRAHAQDFTIQDASYTVVDNEGDEGGYEVELFQVFIQTPDAGYYDQFAYDYLPAVLIPSHQDCNCDEGGDYVVDPWYTYTDYGAYGYDDNTWLDTVEYDIYIADGSDAAPCSGGACSCSGGVEGYPYCAYYAPLEEDIYVTIWARANQIFPLRRPCPASGLGPGGGAAHGWSGRRWRHAHEHRRRHCDGPRPGMGRAGYGCTAGSVVSKVSTIRFYDAATEPLSAKPIPPGNSATVPTSTPAKSAPQVVAVLSAGGEAWGNPAFVARLTQRRVYMQQALTTALADLTAAAATPGTTKGSLANLFQSAQATEQAAAADRDQKACIHTVRGPALVNLQGPAPLSGVIAHETQAIQSRLATLKAYGIGQ